MYIEGRRHVVVSKVKILEGLENKVRGVEKL